MRTFTVFEKGDFVEICEDWRDWKKGEIAIVEKYNPRPSPLHNCSYVLTPVDGSPKDFEILLGYQVKETNKVLTSQQIANFAVNRNGFDNETQRNNCRECIRKMIDYLVEVSIKKQDIIRSDLKTKQ